MVRIFRVLSVDNKRYGGSGTVKVKGKCVPLEYATKDTDDIMVFYELIPPQVYQAKSRIQLMVYWQDVMWEILHCNLEKGFFILQPVPEDKQEQGLLEFAEQTGLKLG